MNEGLVRDIIDIRFACQQATVAEHRHTLGQVLNTLSISTNLRSKILLSYSEVANNLVEHANATSIQMGFKQLTTTWQLTLSDDGEVFDPTIKDSSPLALDDIDLLAESGRGIALIKQQADHISYRAKEHPNLFNTLTLSWQRQQFKTTQVLLVEDELSMRQLYKAYLSEHFEVLEASNGIEALNILKQASVDLIVADIYMPKMNGISLLETLNQDTEIEAIPFIFLTGNEQQTLQDQVRYLGVDSYLTKPITKSALLNAIDKVQQNHQRLQHKLNIKLNQQIESLLSLELPTQINGYQLALKQLTASGGGGDFVFSHPFTHGTLVVIGDVMGHDSRAKFFAHTMVSYLRGIVIGYSEQAERGAVIDLSGLMTKLSNFILHDQIAGQSMLTCQMLYLTSEHIDIVSAGHPAPLLADLTNNQTSGIKPVKTSGMALGLLANQSYRQTRLTLANNQRLICYTDGLFESIPVSMTPEQLQSQVMRILGQYNHLTPQQSADNIINNFSQLVGLPVKDDTLLLIIEQEKSPSLETQ